MLYGEIEYNFKLLATLTFITNYLLFYIIKIFVKKSRINCRHERIYKILWYSLAYGLINSCLIPAFVLLFM